MFTVFYYGEKAKKLGLQEQFNLIQFKYWNKRESYVEGFLGPVISNSFCWTTSWKINTKIITEIRGEVFTLHSWVWEVYSVIWVYIEWWESRFRPCFLFQWPTTKPKQPESLTKSWPIWENLLLSINFDLWLTTASALVPLSEPVIYEE